MNENSRAMAATIAGAVIGGVVGYLFFTENGRTIRRQIEPALEDIARELSSFRSTVQKATEVVHQGWNVLSEALSEGDSSPRYGNLHQRSPF